MTKREYIEKNIYDEDIIKEFPSIVERIGYLSSEFNKQNNVIKDTEKFKEVLIEALTPEKGERGERGEKGEKGEKGDQGLRGSDGLTPIKGIDYFTEEELKHFQEEIEKNIKIPEPQVIEKIIKEEYIKELDQSDLDGISRMISQALSLYRPKGAEIKKELEKLKGDKRLDISAIKGLTTELMGKSGGGGKPLTDEERAAIGTIGNYVLKTGDTMTGTLIIESTAGSFRVIRTSTSEPNIILTNNTAGSGAQIRGLNAGGVRIMDQTANQTWLSIDTNGLMSQVRPTVSATQGFGLNQDITYNPPSAPTSTFGGLNFVIRTAGSTNFTGTGEIYGANAGVNHAGTGTMQNMYGMRAALSWGASAGATTQARVFLSKITYAAASNTSTMMNIHVESMTKTGAGTIGTLYGLYIQDINNATTNYAIRTDAGNVVFNEGGDANTDFRVEGDTKANLLLVDASVDAVIIDGRFSTQMATVASANDLTLTLANVFNITGTTQINTIVATGWQSGSIIVLTFAGSLTVKNATAGTGAQIKLAGSVDFLATADDNLTLFYNGTTWNEIARTVI